VSDRDAANIRIVIVALAALALVLVTGLLALGYTERTGELTTALVGLAGSAVGGLSSMLSRTSTGSDSPPVVLAPPQQLEQVPTAPPSEPAVVFDPTATDASG
jgi:hypothetical protein